MDLDNPTNELYREVFNTSKTGLLLIQQDKETDSETGVQVELNETARRIHGLNFNSDEDDPAGESVRSALLTRVSNVIETGKPERWEFSEPGGRWWKAEAVPINSTTVLTTFSDITDYKRLEEQMKNREDAMNNRIERTIDESQSAYKELDAFTYSVSHDLRAPLRRLDGFSQELLNEYSDKLDEKGIHYLNRIRTAAQKMGSLIDDLLLISRISKKQVRTDTFNVVPIAREIFEELQELEPERNVELSFTGELDIKADSGLFRSLLYNLLSNAWKFTKGNDPAHIELGTTSVDGKKTYYVKDDGVGFDAKFTEKVFRAFQRVHSEREFEGSGIGLATAKRIVNRHGGKIWAESRPGEGTVFYFYLNRNDKQTDK